MFLPAAFAAYLEDRKREVGVPYRRTVLDALRDHAQKSGKPIALGVAAVAFLCLGSSAQASCFMAAAAPETTGPDLQTAVVIAFMVAAPFLAIGIGWALGVISVRRRRKAKA